MENGGRRGMIITCIDSLRNKTKPTYYLINSHESVGEAAQSVHDDTSINEADDDGPDDKSKMPRF